MQVLSQREQRMNKCPVAQPNQTQILIKGALLSEKIAFCSRIGIVPVVVRLRQKE